MTSKHRAVVAATATAIAVLLAGCSDENPVTIQDPASGPTISTAPASDGVTTGAAVTEFFGLYFPAGMPGTGTACPYTWQNPAFCVIDLGSWTALPSGRWQIRDMTVYELAFSWRAGGAVEPRKTGYDVVTANANVDASLSGPLWGTWQLHSFDNVLMFTGTFTGAFENGIPAVHYVGKGTGIYQGQQMRGDISRSPDEAGYNMYGTILEPGAS